MVELVEKYVQKLFEQGLTKKGSALIGAIDDELIWSREDLKIKDLEGVFKEININSILFAEPCEPYKSIIDYLVKTSEDTIYPKDCETRTFIHDLPIIREFSTEKIAKTLSRRKSVIVEGHGIVTYGTVSPEQAFVVYSSVCFASFVKFFSDYLSNARNNSVSNEERAVFEKIKALLIDYPDASPKLMKAPFKSEEDVYKAIFEAGKYTVDYKLVDSYFGNISYKLDNTVFISQTGSSLDELNGCVDPCPVDNSSCCGVTASSELTAHKLIYDNSNIMAILHGHPKFSVILSLDCEKQSCENMGKCHILCSEERNVKDISIVPGEVGTGKYGLCNTIPPAIKGKRGVIVYGHGVFTTATEDFNEAFDSLLDIEKMCMEEYFSRVEGLTTE